MLKCKRCGHEWEQRGDNPPKVCPKCKSKLWDKQKAVDYEKTIKMFERTAKAINSMMINGSGEKGAVLAGTLVISCLMEAEKITSIESLGAVRFRLAFTALEPIKIMASAKSIPEELYYSAFRLSESYLSDWTVFSSGKPLEQI